MLDKHEVEQRICKIKKHGDCAQDVRDLAMLYIVLDHMDGNDDHEMAHGLTKADAMAWVAGMHGEDPAVPHGGKWSMEQVKPIATKYGIPTEGEKFFEFWAVMNAMYSDYYPVAKKYNTLTPDYFADLAMAFISDKDAVKNKAAVYYECIVGK